MGCVLKNLIPVGPVRKDDNVSEHRIIPPSSTVVPVDACVTPGRRDVDGHIDTELRAPAAVHDVDDVALPDAVADPAPDQRVAGVGALAGREAAAAQRDVERGSDPVEQPW